LTKCNRLAGSAGGAGELFEYVRQWNAAHSNDTVTLVGIDAQDNAAARSTVGAFLQTAYGDSMEPIWKLAKQELTVADEQTASLATRNVNEATRLHVDRDHCTTRLDDAILRARHVLPPSIAHGSAHGSWRNSATSTPGATIRCRTLATVHGRKRLEALQRAGANSRGVYWRTTRTWRQRRTGDAGGVLRPR